MWLFCRSLLYCLLLVAWSGMRLLAQPASEQGIPFFTYWSPKDYRADSQNWAVVQDQHGVMYIGNERGLLEYDGVNWRLAILPNQSAVRSLAIDQQGRVFAGAENEIGYLWPDTAGTMQYVSLMAHVPVPYRDFNTVSNTLATRDGVFFRSDKYLFRWRSRPDTPGQGDLHVIHPTTSFHRAFLVRDRLYVRQRGIGLTALVGDSLQLVPDGERFADEGVYAMLPFDRAHLLIGTFTQGLFLYDGVAFQPFRTQADAFLQASQLYHGAVLTDGTFAFATLRGGLAIIDAQGRLVQRVNKAAGLHNDTIGYVYPDREGGLWLGMDNGLARLETPSPLSLFTEPFGPQGAVEDLVRHQGQVYAATAQGVYRLSFTSGQFPAFQPVAGIATQAWAFLSLDNLLLVATNNGVFTIAGDRATQQLADLSAFYLYRSRMDASRVYVGLEAGVGMLVKTQGRWRFSGPVPGTSGVVRSIVEDGEGALWLGTELQGVQRVKFPTRPPGHPIDEGLSVPEVARYAWTQGLPPGYVYVYFVRQRLRFATSRGLYTFDPQRQTFHLDASLGTILADTTATIGHFVEDLQGQLLARLSDQSRVVIGIGVPQEDSTYAWSTFPFRRVAEHEPIWAVYADPVYPGMFWFGSEQSVLRYDPAVEKNYRVDFPALIRKVTVNRQGAGAHGVLYEGMWAEGEKAAPSPPRLPYAHNALRFEFAAPSYDNLSANRYQVLLEGFDQDWSAWTTETRKDYTNLPEGEYRFRVRARNGYDHLSQEAVFAFTILPPWWRTWWAYTLYGLLLGGAVFAVDRVQRRRLLRKERERASLREKELRTEAAEHLANYLQAENKRQTQELEQARQLQLSMLPRTLPIHPTVELAAYMKTATEVGGDYYDADLAEDGTLTLVIGDATGHGLPAGTMVTATKGILGALARQDDLGQVLQTASEAVRRMRLPRLYMALALVRLRGHTLEVAGAGMPPAMVYRAATGGIDVVPLKGMPLGSPSRYPYRVQGVSLSAGDTVLLMSDGLPELRSVTGELLGYERMPELLAGMGGLRAEEVIACVLEAAKAWCEGTAPEDDLTLIVMKMKAPPANGHQGLLTSEADRDA